MTEREPFVSATGHQWPCTKFYVLAPESDPCTCSAGGGSSAYNQGWNDALRAAATPMSIVDWGQALPVVSVNRYLLSFLRADEAQPDWEAELRELVITHRPNVVTEEIGVIGGARGERTWRTRVKCDGEQCKGFYAERRRYWDAVEEHSDHLVSVLTDWAASRFQGRPQ